MTDMRFCIRCHMNKPADTFKVFYRGKFGTHKMYVCKDCAGRMKKKTSPAERAAFGQNTTAMNKSLSEGVKMRNPKQHLNEGQQ